MDHFELRNGVLHAEDVPLSVIAEAVGTPVYVYSRATLERHARVFREALRGLPRVHIAWKDVWIGAATTALLFTVGKVLIGVYIGRSGIASGFGAAASLVVVLVWVYYSAQIFLLGAEFTRAYAHKFGSRRDVSLEDPAEVSPAKPSSNANDAAP